MTKEEVEKLLRHGAYDIFQEDNDGTAEKESTEFIEQDIDTILARRSKTVILENTGSNSNASGSTFSKATFKAFDGSGLNDSNTLQRDIDIDDPDFWIKMVGEPKFEKSEALFHGKKRARTKNVSYSENLFDQSLEEDLACSDASSSIDEDDDNFEAGLSTQKEVDEFDFSSILCNEKLKMLMEHKKHYLSLVEREFWGGKANNEWSKVDVSLIVKLLLRYGYGNIPWDLFFSKFRQDASKTYDETEVRIS
jgi:hypothetical protein